MVCEIQIETENVDELKKIINSLLKKEQEYLSEIKIMKEQILCLQDKLFGRKSEKTSSDDKQLSLFETSEDHFPIAEEDDEIEIRSHKRKKRGRKPIPENLPRMEVIHDLDEAEKQCECGCQKECIGQEVSEQLDIVPAKIQVIRNIRLKYACKNCEGVESDGPTVTIAQMPEQLIPKGIGTSGLIAFVLTAKFVDALPFYRQEKQFLRIGVKISRATMCSWTQKIAESCDILLMMLKKEILSGPLINIDETPFQVLKEPGKTSQSKSYMWIFRGGTQEYCLSIIQPVPVMWHLHF
jgi:transposase